MNVNTKPDVQDSETDKKPADAKDEKRSYYYDDAHGYEVYRAEDDEDDEEETD